MFLLVKLHIDMILEAVVPGPQNALYVMLCMLWPFVFTQYWQWTEQRDEQICCVTIMCSACWHTINNSLNSTVWLFVKVSARMRSAISLQYVQKLLKWGRASDWSLTLFYRTPCARSYCSNPCTVWDRRSHLAKITRLRSVGGHTLAYAATYRMWFRLPISKTNPEP